MSNRVGVNMTKESTKEKILTNAARIIREKGFNNTGIQEILTAAEVPKGSFYFYFKSKEDLGLALVDYYASGIKEMGDLLLRNSPEPPLDRLKIFFEAIRQRFEDEGWRAGCPIGNLTQEMGALSEGFRSKLQNALSIMQRGIRDCLEEAKSGGDLAPESDTDELAYFILNSWEGAILRMKAEGNTNPLTLCQKMIFDRVLR
jgi:TetR/AcrR family transcriptional repressor of nem operon